MNKALLLLATAAFGTAAMAQVAQPTMPGNAPMQENQKAQTPLSTPDNMPKAAPMAPDATMPAPAPAPMPDPAPAPAPMPMASGSAMPAATTTADYPVCSRTITDKCVNKSAAPKKHR